MFDILELNWYWIVSARKQTIFLISDKFINKNQSQKK